MTERALRAFSLDEKKLSVKDAEFRKHLQRRHCLWLPVSLPCDRPGSVPSPPADVALWLFELRHASDSSEILDSLRLNVECENVASEVWIVSGDEDDGGDGCVKSANERQIDGRVRSDSGIDISYRKEDLTVSTFKSIQHLNLGTNDGRNFDVTKVTSESREDFQENEHSHQTEQCLEAKTLSHNLSDVNAMQWELNPVYSGEQLEEIQRNDRQEEKGEKREGTEEQGRGVLATTAITRFRKLCNSVLAELDNIRNIDGSSLTTPTTSSLLLPNGSETNDSVITPVTNDRQENDSLDNYHSCASVSGNDHQSVLDSNTMDSICHASLNCQMSPVDKHRCHFIEESSDKLSQRTDVVNVTIPDSQQCEIGVISGYVAPSVCQAKKPLNANTSECTDVEINTQKMSYMDEKCEEVLKGLDDIIQSLGVDSEDSNTDYEMEPDKEFLDLCQKADDLAEESIENCPVKPKIFPKEVEEIKKTRSITMSSDLSDDVFVCSPTTEKPELLSPTANEFRRHHSLDINDIFDDGITPPVPPARKKKRKQRRKTIEIDGTVSDKCTVNVSLLSEPVAVENKGSASLNEAQDFKMLHIGDEQSQELLLLEKATQSTKERRHAKATSFYEDADACCCQIKTSEGSEQNKICSLGCRLHTSPSLSKGSSAVHIPNASRNASAYGDDLLQYSRSAPESYSEDNCSVSSPLGITLTQTRPISFMEFPPKRPSVEVHTSDVILVSSGDETFQSSTSEYWSANSVLDSSQCEWLSHSRKGSVSSDIVAWKQELQLSGYLDEEGDEDSLMLSNEWYSSNDSEGRVYFFQENSHESSWVLPEISITPSEIKPCPEVPAPSPPVSSKVPPSEGKKKSVKKKQEDDVMLRSSGHLELDGDNQYRMAKAHSMVLVDPRGEKQASGKSSSFPRNWPELWDGNMCVLKEGTLNRTKITENGKKLRKNWAPAHVVLTELFLLFFKDAKAFVAMKNAHGDHSSETMRPELSVDLNGALLERGNKVSSRRNVFLVSTVLGLQVLVQCDNAILAEEWYQAIQKAIKELPSGYSMRPVSKFPQLSPQHLGSTSPDETKKSLQIGRSRSLKVKSSAKDESQEDLATTGENPTKIKARLKKFFHRRPTKESLVKKGIYRDEPVFGCHLPDICGSEPPRIPLFVQRCIAAIESKEENMKTDGLYRASGNLSQVQKIRLQIDQNNLSILEQEEDVHVLTGALKLFFRELRKPLIPFEYFNKALQASTNPNKKEKIQQFREIVKALPACNRETLDFLLKHLLRVTQYQEFNRMHIPNLAIVFGPTLMWPEAESLNMALDLMQQNLVIECFLQEYDSIFR